MQGSIRFFFGLLLTLGAAGGVETSVTNLELGGAVVLAAIGLAIMASGAKALSAGKQAC